MTFQQTMQASFDPGNNTAYINSSRIELKSDKMHTGPQKRMELKGRATFGGQKPAHRCKCQATYDAIWCDATETQTTFTK